MSDFSKRPDELLREIESIRSLLPELAVRNLQNAVAKYRAWRREALEDLAKILEEDDEDESARSWSDLCGSARADAAGFFEDVFNNIELTTDGAATGYRWQLTVIANESKFFETLGNTNAGQVRDYLVANRKTLSDYTETLDDKWRTIVEEGNELQDEEQKLYREMLELTQRIVEEFAMTERTVYEKTRAAGQLPLIALEKGGDILANLLGLPDGVGELVGPVAERLGLQNQLWLDGNRAIQGRAANYRALVQAEKGGVLPLFRDTRRDVYEYWEKNNVERAADWMKRFQQSLESEWISGCPTPGQQDDAKDFYKDALARVQRHLDAVKTVAGEFEARWNGVFKGALRPDTVDELVDAASWRMNAETIVAIGAQSKVEAWLAKMDGYYETSFEEPLSRLKSAAEQLEGEQRTQALEAVRLVYERVEESVRARIKVLHNEVAASLAWFAPEKIEQTLDRTELEDALE